MDDSSVLERARALLAQMISARATTGSSDVEGFTERLRAVSGPIAMMRLDIAAGAVRLPVVEGPMTGFYVVDDRDQLIGELMLWIEDGQPSTLEYAWYSDEPPTALPEPRQMVLELPNRTEIPRTR